MLEILLQWRFISGEGFGDALHHDRKDRDGIGAGIARVAAAIAEAGDSEIVLHLGEAEVGESNNKNHESEVKPEKRGAWGNVRDSGGREEVGDGSRGKEVEREREEEGGERDEEKNREGGSLDEEELGGVSAAVEGDLGEGRMIDGKELGKEGGGSRDEAVVTAELDEEEEEEAGGSAGYGDIEQILDVAIPRRGLEGRVWRRRCEGRHGRRHG